ncbi:MAG TPA: sensor histidine kinase [Nitriliruptorales bacterium]|nr:sensor histidine kinase [Nitriliruptorales bacterium]
MRVSGSSRPHPLAVLGVVALWTALKIWNELEDASPFGLEVVWIVGVAAMVAAVLLWWLHPDRRFGQVLIAAQLLYRPGGFLESGSALLFTLAFVTRGLGDPLMSWLVLAYPEGRLKGRLDRAVVALNAVVLFADGALKGLFDDPQRYCDRCPQNLALVRSVPALVEPREIAVHATSILLMATILAIMVARWRRASSVRRRILTPVTVPVVIIAAGASVRLTIALAVEVPGGGFQRLTAATDIFGVVAYGFLPVGVLIGLFVERRRRSRVGGLVVELSELASVDRLEPALAHTVGDPSLTLGIWDPDRRGYVRPSGEPLDLPNDDDPDRAVTHLGRPGQALGVLVHDPALRHDPGLIGAVRAAAQLAVDNERLNAELLDQLHELEASRARIATAADEATRRIERDLHDGAQQRLLSLAMGLRIAQISANPGTRAELEALAVELDTALRELRELTRGIHPSLLTDRGLPAALRALGDRAVIPVLLEVNLERRLHPSVEGVAYYVVSEGITNAAKHASAECVHVGVHVEDDELVVRISDDGKGGAQPDGSGLRGLADRVAAIEGTFEVSSFVGSGTTLTARLPVRYPASAAV